MGKKITLFKSLRTTNDPHHVELDYILDRIRSGNQRDLVDRIRLLSDKSDRNILKKDLQCVLFSGEFKRRNAKGLISYSGLI